MSGSASLAGGALSLNVSVRDLRHTILTRMRACRLIADKPLFDLGYTDKVTEILDTHGTQHRV